MLNSYRRNLTKKFPEPVPKTAEEKEAEAAALVKGAKVTKKEEPKKGAPVPGNLNVS